MYERGEKQRPAEELRQGKGERVRGKGEAARWRANTFGYWRNGGSPIEIGGSGIAAEREETRLGRASDRSIQSGEEST